MKRNDTRLSSLKINSFITLPDFEYIVTLVRETGTKKSIEMLQDLFVQGYDLGKNNGWVDDREDSLK